MPVTRISAADMPPQFSDDGGTTWQTLVCITDWSLTGATTTNETETFCGKFTSRGVAGMTGSANAVANITPDATEVSLEEATNWWINDTTLSFRVQHPASGTPGTDYFISGSATINNVSVTGTAGQDVQFSIDWSINGAIDNTP